MKILLNPKRRFIEKSYRLNDLNDFSFKKDEPIVFVLFRTPTKNLFARFIFSI
jgi:hypothetical protein